MKALAAHPSGGRCLGEFRPAGVTKKGGVQKSHMHSGGCVPHAADRRRTDRAGVGGLICFCVGAPVSQSATAALAPPQDARSPEEPSIRSDALRS